MATIISISTLTTLMRDETSLSCRGPVNPSTPTFGYINLTESITNLIAVWKFNQKRMQKSLFAA